MRVQETIVDYNHVQDRHKDYDQYRLFPREAAMTVGRAWAADAQRRIKAMGLWPTNLSGVNE